MRITQPEIIQKGERELMDTIIADLDWGVIEAIFKEQHHLNIEDDIEYKKGDIVVYQNNIAYSIEFEGRITLNLLCDREGNFLSVSSSLDIDETPIVVTERMDNTKHEKIGDTKDIDNNDLQPMNECDTLVESSENEKTISNEVIDNQNIDQMIMTEYPLNENDVSTLRDKQTDQINDDHPNTSTMIDSVPSKPLDWIIAFDNQNLNPSYDITAPPQLKIKQLIHEFEIFIGQ